MTIVISMAGLSQRFIKEGFTLPKYMLYVKNKSLFNLAVSSFEYYFRECNFIFVARELFDTRRFITEECKLLGIHNYEIIILDQPTKGQAETVFLGLTSSKIFKQEPITIFNIDTFRIGFRFPEKLTDWDGYLEVFHGDGQNWSYARTESAVSTRVLETAEKNQISNYCSTGLYYFKTAELFIDVFKSYTKRASINAPVELYIAPVYNLLIEQNRNIHIHLIEKTAVLFCGTPDEYYDYLKKSIVEI